MNASTCNINSLQKANTITEPELFNIKAIKYICANLVHFYWPRTICNAAQIKLFIYNFQNHSKVAILHKNYH